MQQASHTPVLIVGAGPAGASLALELCRYGVPFRLIDKAQGPTTESRALGLSTRTLELLHRTAAGPAIASEARAMDGFIAYGAKGTQLAELPLSVDPAITRYPHEMVLPQSRTQSLLHEALERQGARVEFSTEAVELQAGAGSARALLRHGGQQEEWVEADWVVGGDGANSFVRRASGVNFIGTEYEEKFLLADVTLHWSLSDHYGHLFLRPNGPIVAFPYPYPNQWRLIDTSNEAQSGDQAPTVERFTRLFGEFVPEMRIERAGWTSLFRIHRRLVDRYRVGRVLLMGDAAHIHSPASGQGLNTGVQDAINLAWKLALVVQGRSSEALLDSYMPERRPVAEGVLKDSHTITEMVLTHNPVMESVRDALLHLALGLEPVKKRLADGISKLGTNYRRSPIVRNHGNGTRMSFRAGDRLPDPQVTSGARLSDILTRGLKHQLLVFGEGDMEFRQVVDRRQLTDLVEVRPASEFFGSGLALSRSWGIDDWGAVLVRPDCYVAFCGSSKSAGELAGAVGGALDLVFL